MNLLIGMFNTTEILYRLVILIPFFDLLLSTLLINDTETFINSASFSCVNFFPSIIVIFLYFLIFLPIILFSLSCSL